jgi:segregation and condensation protein B
MTLDSKIEAVLFFKGEPIDTDWLVKTLEVSKEEIEDSLKVLEEKLSSRGLTLIFEGDTVLMGTSPDASSLIEKITKEELVKDLGKASLETLSIVLYKKTVAKRDIDYIRGVNSAFILRNLMIRGLVERVEVKGERGFSYKPTTELMAFLGISKLEDLPEYENVLNEFADFSKKEESLAENNQTDG